MLRGLAGDANAHAQLLGALSGHLRAYFARRIGPGVAETEDLVQETLLAIHLKRDTYDARQPFTPWAYAIGRYKLLDHFRRRGVRKSVPLEDAGVLIAAETAEAGATRRDLAQLMAEAGVTLGLEKDAAQRLAAATLYGAGMLAHAADADLVQLRAQVTSAGGTTAAAVQVMENADLRGTIARALAAAVARSHELAALRPDPDPAGTS